MTSNQTQFSKDFFELVKSIGECRTKQEEDRIVMHEIRNLKAGMNAKDVQLKRMREYLIRMIYVEMLGHDASFGHIQGIKLVSSRNLLEKRIGYLAVELTLHKDHQLLLLLVNAIQTDLRSDNFLEVSMALGALSTLVNTDITPAVLPLVVALLDHKQPVIRKKAVMCLHRFFQLDPAVLAPLGDKVKQALCDADPSVMGAALILLRGLATAEPAAYKDLVPSLVSILKQVVEHRLPRDFDYHRLPAPWIQLDLLRLLAVLGRNDKHASAQMQQVLADVIRRAAIGTNIGYAVVHECVRAATTIYPHGPLLEAAAQAVTHFLTSPNHNLKYLGVTALAAIVRVDARHAVAHQLTVVDCLEDPDETLRHRTLDLLCAMTNPENVVAIVGKLIGHLRASGDGFMRGALVQRIAALAEQFAPDTAWYVATMNDVLSAGGAHVPPSVAQGLLRLLAQPAEVSGVDMDAVRQRTVDVYAGFLCSGQPLSDLMVQTVAWTLGEYGELASEVPLDALVSLLCGVAHRQFADGSVRYWVLAAVQSLLARLPEHAPPPSCLLPTLRACQCSRDLALQQKARECLALLDRRALLARVNPTDLFSAPPRVDPNMAFLQPFVAAALASGAQEYHAHAGGAVREKKALRFDAYEKPEAPVLRAAGIDFLAPAGQSDAPAAATSSSTPAAAESGLKLKSSAKMWGPKGFNAKKPAPAPAPAAPEPEAVPAPASEPAPASPTAAEPPGVSPRFQPRQSALAAQQTRGKTAAAQTLFAGVGGARASTKPSSGKPSLFAGITLKPSANARAPPAPAPALAASPAPAAVSASASLDLLMSAASPAPAPAPADALGDFFSFAPAPASSPAPAAQSPLDFLSEPSSSSAASASSSMDVLSAFAGLDMAAPAPASASASARAPDADLLALMAASSQETADAIDARMGLGLGASPATDLPHAHAAQVALQAWVRPTPLASHVVIMATNRTAAHIALTLAAAVPSSHARATASAMSGAAPVDVRSNGSGYHTVAAELAPQQAVAVILAVDMAAPAAFPAPSVAATLQAPGISVSASVPVPAHALLRPQSLVTKHYAEAWKALGLAGEVKSGVVTCRRHTGITNDDVLALLRQLQLHPVQTIKQETIAAATIMGTNETLLVHIRIVDGGVTVQARCKHQAVAQGIVQSFQSSL